MTLQQDQQDISDAEAALQALGVASEIYSQVLQQLIKRRNALQDIQTIQQHQFHPDAFSLISRVQSMHAGSDKVVAISQFLRLFAEYIATQTLTLQQIYPEAIAIIDHIVPMGGEN